MRKQGKDILDRDLAPQDARDNRANWVRLRTLIVLRWIAICGQLFAIGIARWLFDLDLNLGLCFLAIGASVVANLIAMSLYPENKRLTEAEVASMLTFDIFQLIALLYLCGGLNNPFALLLLAPVTISATALKTSTTAAIAGATIVLAALLDIFHVPLVTRDGVVLEMPDLFVSGFLFAIMIGVVFVALYASRVTAEVHAMSDALSAMRMALAREQKLTDLGGVVAAAAHELGTPLATIKLASAELIEELDDKPELQEDARLIRDQADRCRDILRSMGRAGKDDPYLRHAPISAVVRESAEPHSSRGIDMHYDIAAIAGANPHQPEVIRRPEMIHGLRNLIQNAVDFARSTVWVDVFWDETHITVRIVDDGPGFPPHVLGRIGDPFVRSRDAAGRKGYDGMGLGLFIAKTLLERIRADVSFANGLDGEPGERTGAIVETRWRLSDIAASEETVRAPVGDNQPIEI